MTQQNGPLYDNLLSALRDHLNLPKDAMSKDIAAALGISQSYFSKIVHGKLPGNQIWDLVRDDPHCRPFIVSKQLSNLFETVLFGGQINCLVIELMGQALDPYIENGILDLIRARKFKAVRVYRANVEGDARRNEAKILRTANNINAATETHRLWITDTENREHFQRIRIAVSYVRNRRRVFDSVIILPGARYNDPAQFVHAMPTEPWLRLLLTLK